MSQDSYSCLVGPLSQETAEDDMDFLSPMSSQQHDETPNLSQEVMYTPTELFRLSCFAEWRQIEQKYLRSQPAEVYGWCKLVTKATNKNETNAPLPDRKGYIQLSFQGLNKVSQGFARCGYRWLTCFVGDLAAPPCCNSIDWHCTGSWRRCKSPLPSCNMSLCWSSLLGKCSEESG